MKSFLIVLSLFVLLVSCDGRSRKFKTNKEVLKENKLLDSFSTNTTYFPAEYNEKTTDTLLSNNLKIRIKHYSLKNESILNNFKVDTITYKHYYRRFAADILVEDDNKQLFSKTINKIVIEENNKANQVFLNQAIMRLVWLDEESSLKNNNATINILFCKPETDDCLFYKLIVERNGSYSLKLTDDVFYDEN